MRTRDLGFFLGFQGKCSEALAMVEESLALARSLGKGGKWIYLMGSLSTGLWQSGSNAIDIARPDTISPIPEGIPLLEAERVARKWEPGDGSRQKEVVEQIRAALTMANGGESLPP